jgi:hypothetical protein
MVTLVNTRDAVKPRKPDKPGTVPAHQIPIYDHRMNMRGRVNRGASSVTVSRFGVHGATLQTVKGRKAWVGVAPGKPHVSAIPLSKSLKADRGSVGSR